MGSKHPEFLSVSSSDLWIFFWESPKSIKYVATYVKGLIQSFPKIDGFEWTVVPSIFIWVSTYSASQLKG